MKTLLADDHPLMREGMRQVLAQLEPALEIIDAHDYPSLFSQTAEHPDLDLALVDLDHAGLRRHAGHHPVPQPLPGHSTGGAVGLGISRTTFAARSKPARSATSPRRRPPR